MARVPFLFGVSPFSVFVIISDMVIVDAVDHAEGDIDRQRGGAATAHEGQGDADDGEHAETHADVFHRLHHDHGGNADANEGTAAAVPVSYSTVSPFTTQCAATTEVMLSAYSLFSKMRLPTLSAATQGTLVWVKRLSRISMRS